MAKPLRIGGLTPLSSVDYPDHLSAVLFCQGCPWRCRYCHNPHLLPAHGRGEIEWRDALDFLERRRGLLDAVVFSGGEPTLHPGLADAMLAVKQMGFRVGLHTAGIYPRRLQSVLSLVDWIGLDVKAPFAAYESVTGRCDSGAAAYASLRLVLASGVDHEIRTTVDPALLPAPALRALIGEIAASGVRRCVLQECRGGICASSCYLDAGFLAALSGHFDSLSVRRA